MSNDRAKTPRTFLIADHIWDAFSTMAVEMGSERDALINQALYTFARLNGFLLAADLQNLGVVPKTALTDSGRLRIAPASGPTLVADRPGAARGQANPERGAEMAQQLAAGGIPRRTVAPPSVPARGEAEDAPPAEEAGAGTSLDLPADASPEQALVLLAEGRELDRVAKDRFLIGRGKHCDLVINSGKVSREHAAITREGQAWFIEDLGSSNGTWFDAHRITRRQIHDGDEYFISSEKLSCAFR
jgi:FHA domain-containing protein